MTSNRFNTTIKDMWNLYLQRQLVRLLHKYYLKYDKRLSRDEVVSHFTKKKSRCFKYFSESKDEFYRRINSVFGGCIPPSPSQNTPRDELKNYYVGYNDDGSENLIITHKGIKFIGLGGYIETLWEEYKGVRALLFWIASTIITIAITYFTVKK